MSNYETEETYAIFIAKRRWAKANRGAECPSTEKDWAAVGNEQFPDGKYALFTCLICDAEFMWCMGNYHTTRLLDMDNEPPMVGRLTGLPDMPWWGWPLMVAVIPLAIPVALTVLAGEKVYYWWHKRRV